MGPDDSQLTGDRMADISALADGSLAEPRRAEVEALVAASPALAEALAEQRSAVALLRDPSAHEPAPARLRAAIASPAGRPRRAPRRHFAAIGGLASAAAAAVVAVVLASAGDGSAVSQAAALAARGATAAAPAPDPQAPRTRLGAAVQDVYFPNWSTTLGWRATGQRIDTVAGHRAVTVFYAAAGRPVAYTILSSPPAPEPSGSLAVLDGLRLRVLTLAGRRVVTWRRDGHTCVLSSDGVAARTLEQLAVWASAARV